MITRRNVIVALSLVAIFCVSFAIFWQRLDRAERPSPGPVPISEPVTPPPVAVSDPQVPTVVEAPSAPTPPPKASSPAQSKYDGPELPVVFSVVARRIYTTEDGTDGEPVNVTKNVTEGVVVNSSDGPLTLNVTEVNSQTHEKSQTQIVLAQNMQKRFGVDQGLSMLSGDEITLRNPSYQELTRQIP